MRRLILKSVVFAVLVAAGLALTSLEFRAAPAAGANARGLLARAASLRLSIPDARQYRPSAEELRAQAFQRTDPEVGFLWKPGLDGGSNATLTWGDQEPAPIVTDSFGFINGPDAINELRSGRRPDIVGLGASFMQGAASVFYDFFAIDGLFYYSMATHRHTLPMFNTVLATRALPLRPRWVIYELNEASPALIGDYEAWRRSGMDWFAYHSGTWSGPPVTSQYHLAPLERLPAVNNLAIAVLQKVWRKKPLDPGTLSQQRDKCLTAIAQADSMARTAGAALLVLYIPSKETIHYGKSRMSPMIDELLPLLRSRGVRVLDLREPFNATGDPRSLYYVEDGHWNKDGVLVAARAVAAALADHLHDEARR